MEIIRGLSIVGETVRLDQRHFINCTFTNCVLEYGGSEVILEGTSFHNCRHALFDQAFMTLRYLQAIGVVPWASLTPVIEVCAQIH